MSRNSVVLTFALLATTVLIQGCAAVLASNEHLRDGLIPKIEHGMTRGQVTSVLGKPDEVMAFRNTETVSWDYRYTDTWGYMAMYSVTFNANWRVVSTFSRRLNDGRGGLT